MCSPGAVLAASLISTGLNAYGQIQAGANQAKIANYQAKVDRNNAIVADQNAKLARDRGSREEVLHRIKVGQMIGEQRVGFAASGVELDSGSALDIQMDTAQMGELDSQMIRYNADLEARGYEQQASDFRSSAVVRQAEGSAAKTAGYLGAGASLIGGIGKAFGTYNKSKGG